ncbi:hypothetical protein LX70_00405 [Defluviimonas denitrificans]|jgi:hypothetical protein|uniref:Uncharacterized protein n=1 Tax=Albidovulum denitrificans TaxID=404881 RepID=A0A2S8SCT5_9RHOB|nr:hypothetical protein [Defluviimonas denitrificans]PQV58593.1 hypothetical protein LX70_00405 [Defluviimonas denitrificans]
MRSPRQPPFLARKTYRRRRMMDAARLLPLLGIFLFLLPILWQPRLTPEPDTVHGVVYLFGAWTVLVIAARVLARIVMTEPDEGGPDDRDEAG